MSNRANTAADAATMNMLIDGLNCLALALATSMPPGQRKQFADHLARLAKNAEKKGDTLLETLLIELHHQARH